MAASSPAVPILLDPPKASEHLRANLRKRARDEAEWLKQDLCLGPHTPSHLENSSRLESPAAFFRMCKYGNPLGDKRENQEIASLSRFCAAHLPQLVESILRIPQLPINACSIDNTIGRLLPVCHCVRACAPYLTTYLACRHWQPEALVTCTLRTLVNVLEHGKVSQDGRWFQYFDGNIEVMRSPDILVSLGFIATTLTPMVAYLPAGRGEALLDSELAQRLRGLLGQTLILEQT